jgi:predicted aconitase
MAEYKMQLTDEETQILDGKKGETLQKALRSVVLYGEAFGAKRLLPIDSAVHLVTSFGIPLLKPVFSMMDELTDSGLSVKPFTVNPRPLDSKNIKYSIPERIVFKIMYGKQKFYEEQLKKMGLKDGNAFTCTCYLPEVGNTPKCGEILAWAESSAVVFANSVLGARTNRNSGVIELLCGIVKKVPEFGLVTDEGRRASWRVEIKTTRLPEAQVLGSAIGLKVTEDVPYITGLDAFLGTGMSGVARDYLKDMGAASASNGAVGLYHVENITPEAVEQKDGLLLDNHKTYVIDDAELQRVRDSYPVMWKDAGVKPSLCFIGCPHLSTEQLYAWTDKIADGLREKGRKMVAVRTLLCASPDVAEKFKKDEKAYVKLLGTGARLTSICALMYMNNPLCAKKPVATNSNKLRTYTTARYFTDSELLQVMTMGSVTEMGVE